MASQIPSRYSTLGSECAVTTGNSASTLGSECAVTTGNSASGERTSANGLSNRCRQRGPCVSSTALPGQALVPTCHRPGLAGFASFGGHTNRVVTRLCCQLRRLLARRPPTRWCALAHPPCSVRTAVRAVQPPAAFVSTTARTRCGTCVPVRRARHPCPAPCSSSPVAPGQLWPPSPPGSSPGLCRLLFFSRDSN